MNTGKKILSAFLALIMVFGALISAPFTAGAASNAALTLVPVNDTVDPGMTAKFTLIVEGLGTDPSSNQISSVVFTSSDTSVADDFTVSSPVSYTPAASSEATGLSYTVSALAFSAGAATVTAAVTDNNGNVYTCTGFIIVRGIIAKPNNITLEVGQACVIFAERYGLSSAESSVNLAWTKDPSSHWLTLGTHSGTTYSRNEAFYVKGNSEGIGTVTVSLRSGGSVIYSDTVNVTVVEKKAVTITQDGIEVTEPIYLGGEMSSAELEADTEGFVNPVITWQSSDPSVVSVTPDNSDGFATVTRLNRSESVVAVSASATDGSVTRTKTVCIAADPSPSLNIYGNYIYDPYHVKHLTLNEGETEVLFVKSQALDPTATVWSADTGGGTVPVKLNSTVGEFITVTGRLSTENPVRITATNEGCTDSVYVTVIPEGQKSLKITGKALGADGVLALTPGDSAQLSARLSGFAEFLEVNWTVSNAANNENLSENATETVSVMNSGDSSAVVTALAASTDFAKVKATLIEGGKTYTDEIYVKVTGSNIINSANYLTIFKNDAVTLQTVSGSADWQSTSFKLYFQDPNNPSPTASNQVTNFSGASATLTAKQNLTTSLPVKITAVQDGETDSVYVHVANGSLQTVTASFDLNGGYGTAPAPVAFVSSGGSCSIMLEKPDAHYPCDDGEYEFYGWSKYADAASNTNQIANLPVYFPGQIYTVTESVRLYAIWVKKSENVTFRIRLDGIIPAEPSNQDEYSYAKSGIYIENALENAAFCYDTNGVERSLAKLPSDADIARVLNLEYTDGSPVSYDPENDRIIWYVVKRVSDDPAGLPCWRVDGVLLRGGKVSLTYDKNTSAADISSFPNPPRGFYDADEYGVAYAGITETVPRCSGSTFIGWNTKPDGSGQWFTSTGTLYGGFQPPEAETVQTAVSLTEDMTLYAIWSGVGIRAVWESGEPADEVRVTYGGEEYVLNENNNRVLQLPFSSDDYPEAAAIPGYFSSVREYRIEGSGSEMRYYTITYTKVFDSHALVLSGEIGVIFNVNLKSIDTENAYMTYETGKVGSAKQTIDNATYDNDTGLWSFTCYLGSYRMADAITPVLHYFENGEEKTVTGAPYAVTDYTAFVEKNPELYENSVADFCEALEAYGYYSQQYLGRIHSFTVGDGESDKYAAVTAAETIFNDDALEAIKGGVSGYAPGKTIDENRVSKASFSLDLESATSLYVNITVKNGAAPTRAQLADGTQLPVTQRSKNVYRVSLDGIKASQLLDWYTIQVLEGENVIAEATVSPMSYVYLVLNNNSGSFAYDDIRNLVAAFYTYAHFANEMINP